jgi:hypothetical protein
MTPRDTAKKGRRETCDKEEARAKLRRAEQFIEVAMMIKDEDDPDWQSAGAALAVLAGISASDAACCYALGHRSRGPDHHDAEAYLIRIEPGGKAAAQALRRLIDLKDEAHYGFHNMSNQNLRSSYTQAEKLISFAGQILSR